MGHGKLEVRNVHARCFFKNPNNMKITSFRHRLVKAGRIKSDQEVKMLDLTKEAGDIKRNFAQRESSLSYAREIRAKLPKAIKSNRFIN